MALFHDKSGRHKCIPAQVIGVLGKLTTVTVSRDSSVDIATRYGLDGFSPPVRPAWRPPTPTNLYSGYRVSLPGIKRPGRGVDHPYSSGAEVKEGVELLPLLLWTFMACTRVNFTFTFNPLKPELNPICYLLALLGAHHFLHVSRIRVKLLTLR